jgi:predicted outer membrane protein
VTTLFCDGGRAHHFGRTQNPTGRQPFRIGYTVHTEWVTKMNRRNALLAFSGAMATPLLVSLPRLAMAQTTKLPTLDFSQYKTETLMLGALSQQASALAAQRARNANVKQFAQFEIAEQTTMHEVLTDGEESKPIALDSAHAAILTQLQGADDKSFDRGYVQDQLNVHAELLNTQQSFLNSRPTSDDHRHVAMLARTVIQMHLTMLQDLQARLAA